MQIKVEELFDAGVHFGHQLKRWNPKARKYVFAHRNGVSIIDLEMTKECLEKACQFIEEYVASGKDILMVGTKRQAQEIIREAARATQMPFCASRWLGGCLTNFETIKKSLEKYKRYLRMEADGSMAKLPKKEISAIRREMNRMHRNFEGIQDITSIPEAMFVVDINHEYIAVAEAIKTKIPIVALVDTNSDPTLITYAIPGNDDSVKSIRVVVEIIMDAIQKGLAQREAPEKSRKTVRPIVSRQEMLGSGPEVTIASDINLEEVERTQTVNFTKSRRGAKAEASVEETPKEETKS